MTLSLTPKTLCIRRPLIRPTQTTQEAFNIKKRQDLPVHLCAVQKCLQLLQGKCLLSVLACLEETLLYW